jgi:hypothetical protein
MPIDACRAILAVMPELIREPSRVTAAGEPPKLIDEYVGQASTRQAGLSIAHMRSPAGWAEPGQRPEFDEFTIVLRGALAVESERGQMTVRAAREFMPGPGKGCATALREVKARSTFPSACQPSPLVRSTAMTDLYCADGPPACPAAEAVVPWPR